jgi:uncharacterized protein (DUF3820 family)
MAEFKKYSMFNRMPFGEYRGELIGTLIEEIPERVEWYVNHTEFRLDDQALEMLEAMLKEISA